MSERVRRGARRAAERGAARGVFGPGSAKYAFLPWLILGAGALSNVLQGEVHNRWLGGVALTVFNSLYISVVLTAFGARVPRRHIPPMVALTGLTAVTFAVAVGYGGTWLFFFLLLALASGTVRQLSGRRLFVWLSVLGLAAGAVTAWRSDPWNSLALAYGTFISGMVTATVRSLFDTVGALDKAREELARTAVESERMRFSRDLHDLLGHTLSVVVVKAEAVRRLAPRDIDAALAQASDIETVGRQALTEIREAVTGYREDSLATELDRARSVLEAAGIEPVVRQSGPPLTPRNEVLLGWVVREGTTNTVRHSEATRCEIEVRAAADRVRLTVTDDGRGPAGGRAGPVAGGTPGAVGAPVAYGARPVGGTGLTGLGERLAAAGGTLDHGPDGRRGFRVVVELPVETAATARDTAPHPEETSP